LLARVSPAGEQARRVALSAAGPGAGGRREVVVPPGLGLQCSPLNEDQPLVYDVRLLRVSVPPS